MKREELEHLIRAAGAVADVRTLVIIGSQSILGAHPAAPEDLLRSREADMYPLEDPSRAALIDGSIGEKSPFHETFSYYAHGVGPDTAVLPTDWRSRVIAVSNENTNGITGLCLHPHDLAVSKLIAGRPRDIAFVESLLRHQLVDVSELKKLLRLVPSDRAVLAEERLGRCLKQNESKAL